MELMKQADILRILIAILSVDLQFRFMVESMAKSKDFLGSFPKIGFQDFSRVCSLVKSIKKLNFMSSLFRSLLACVVLIDFAFWSLKF